MARPIVLSNGELHVGINNYGLVHDFYFPYVGLENHAAGQSLRHKVGVWVDGAITWLDDGSWDHKFRIADDGLIGHTTAYNKQLDIVLEFDDFVASDATIFFRNVHVINQSDTTRDVRLFMHQAFVIGDSRSNTDTAQYLPDSNAILHYRGRRVFVVSGQEQDGNGFDQHSIGLFGIEGREGTYRDADDGELSNGAVEHGRVDSTIRFQMNIAPHSSRRIHYWITCASSLTAAINLHSHVKDRGLYEYLKRTHDWWKGWLEKAIDASQAVPQKYRPSFVKSSLIIKSHIDKRGAIIASTDTALLKQSRDAYGYCWPRDGAHAIWPLIRMGYREEPQKFFEFCQSVLHPNGYLGHKYRADAALGPSWHPYDHGDITAPPIQEDETASVLFMFCQFYHAQPSRALLDIHYKPFVKEMATFLTKHVDSKTNLPLPSYELWEEQFIVSTYTTAVTQAALRAAAELAEIVDDQASAVTWRSTADDMVKAAKSQLFDAEQGRIVKGLRPVNGHYEKDTTLDLSSFYASFIFGLFPITGEELTRTLEAIESVLLRDHPGLPRYENDMYLRTSGDALPNDWIITSLWRAQYFVETDQMQKADEILAWVLDRATDTGLFPEQLHPTDHTPISVMPLIWSHAEYLSTLLDIKEPS